MFSENTSTCTAVLFFIKLIMQKRIFDHPTEHCFFNEFRSFLTFTSWCLAGDKQNQWKAIEVKKKVIAIYFIEMFKTKITIIVPI